MAAPPTLEVVRKIDHVYAVLDNAEAAFEFMRAAVGLPVAWPFMRYGDFASGAIGLGNLNLEFVAPAPGWVPQRPARLTGIAFEPAGAADEALVTQLDRRGIEHSALMPTPGWTNLGLEGLGAEPFAFVCDYHIPQAKDGALRRSALEASGGGILGVNGATEVVLGTPSVSTSQASWQRLLDPVESDDDHRWTIGSGPALRLVAHDRNEVIDLTLAVDDPDVAGAVWLELTGNEDPLESLPVSFARGDWR